MPDGTMWTQPQFKTVVGDNEKNQIMYGKFRNIVINITRFKKYLISNGST